jgi:hypothetical protein
MRTGDMASEAEVEAAAAALMKSADQGQCWHDQARAALEAAERVRAEVEYDEWGYPVPAERVRGRYCHAFGMHLGIFQPIQREPSSCVIGHTI